MYETTGMDCGLHDYDRPQKLWHTSKYFNLLHKVISNFLLFLLYRRREWGEGSNHLYLVLFSFFLEMLLIIRVASTKKNWEQTKEKNMYIYFNLSSKFIWLMSKTLSLKWVHVTWEILKEAFVFFRPLLVLQKLCVEQDLLLVVYYILCICFRVFPWDQWKQGQNGMVTLIRWKHT